MVRARGMNPPVVGVHRLKDLPLRRKRLKDLKALVTWFLEEERDYVREDESRVFDLLLKQASFPGKAQDKELVKAFFQIESRSAEKKTESELVYSCSAEKPRPS